MIVVSLLTVLYYASSAFVLYFFARYINEYFELKRPARTIFLWIITLLCSVQIFFAVISPFTGAIFTITVAGYQRGSLFAISQLVPLLCYLSFTWLVVLHRKKLSRREVILFVVHLYSAGRWGITDVIRGIAVVNIGVTLALAVYFCQYSASERDLLISAGRCPANRRDWRHRNPAALSL